MIRLGARRTPRGQISRNGRAFAAAQRRAAHIAVDKASSLGHRRIRQKMKAVGLGKLGNAVGHTSSRKKGQMGEGRNAWGVVFARGGDDSLAGGALESYTQGSTIRPTEQEWLWFQTTAIPRRVGRFRTTPARYNASGLATTIGPLVMRRLSANRAQLIIRKVTISPKTGRAKADLGRRTRTRIRLKEIVAFVGIRWTRRAKRLDQNEIMSAASALVPRFLVEETNQILAKAP